jgi:hypothetical protein
MQEILNNMFHNNTRSGSISVKTNRRLYLNNKLFNEVRDDNDIEEYDTDGVFLRYL